MSQFNRLNVPTLSTDQLLVNGFYINTQYRGNIYANGGNVLTTPLTTEVIINDQTKNQALFANIVTLEGEVGGNISGNIIQIQNEIDALEGNVTILQGNVVSLQNQINVLSGNVVIDEEAIAELIRDTQFLEAPHAGLAGNTSYFWRGLQVYNTPTDAINETTGTGIFSYLDGNVSTPSQIQLRVEDSRNVFVKGSTTINTPENGLVSIGGSGNVAMTFNVGNSGTNNNVQVNMNGNINLKGDGGSRVSVYTTSTIVPPVTTRKAEIVGADEANVLGKKVTATSNDGGTIVLTSDATMSGTSVNITASGQAQIYGGGGAGRFYGDTGGANMYASNGKGIDIQCSSGNSNSTINIGTQQGTLDTGYTTINIGNANSATLRTSSIFLDGDTYLPKIPANPGGWDNLAYIGLPTISSGALHGPLKSTFNPYIRSISAFCPEATANSFFQTSGTFTVNVGLGAISLMTGTGGLACTCAAGLMAFTSAIGGIGMTTAGGAIALTTGAGIIQMTTGAAPIAMETNIGDILLKAGYSNQSTPELSLGSVYIQARDYSYITPDKGVIVGEGIVTPFNENLLDTMGYPLTGNIFANTIIGGGNLRGVFSNTFVTPGSTTTLLNPVNSNLVYSNLIYETGTAYAILRNMDVNGNIATSSAATVPSGNLGANVAITNTTTNFYFPDNTLLPLNANVKLFVYVTDTPNIANYKYSTWQANAQIQSNISGLVNAYVEPLPPSYENYMTVLGNVGILADLDVGANITVASSSFPAQQTLITRNSVTTTGNVTCNTLNYTTLNPPIAPGGVESIIAGTNISISPLSGIGDVTINCTLPNIAVAGVNQIIAGNGIEITPLGGQGNVTVSLAGSVIPPGGYLPIAGGIMTGEIYQYPSTGNVAENTYKLYRPQSSYQPPFPSIGPPTQTGELLTFYNGDDPANTNFTGWFPQNTFQYEPDAISNNIQVVPATFYTSTGGTPTGTPPWVVTQINQFKVGDHLTSVEIYITGWLTIQGQALQILTSDDPNGWNSADVTVLYKIDPGTPPGPYPAVWTIPIDFTYTGGQKAYNFFNIIPYTGYETPGIISTIGYQIGAFTNFQGSIFTTGFATTSYFIGVLGDETTSVLYEYFPSTGLSNKLLAVTKASGVARIHGIYSDDSATSRQIIVYGDFENTVQTSTTVVNNIFMYNIDTNTVIQLTTQTADPAYSGNLPKGVNGAVWGVEKQVSSTVSRRVWIWGDFTGVAQMGNPSQPTDCTLSGGLNATTSDNWAVAIEWDFGYAAGQGPFNCRGGKIINNVIPGSPNDFLLLVYCGGRFTNNTYNSLSMIYYNTVIAPGFLTSPFPFSNGSITSGLNNAVDYITIVDTSIIMTGEYTGTAQGASATDIPIYSIMRAPLGTFDKNSGQYSTLLYEMANSGNASFWVEGTNQIGVSRIKLLQGGETLVLGTYGYGTSSNGGGVLTFNFLDVTVVDTPAVKFTIAGIPPYTVLNIANDIPTDVLLSCSLNQDNYWFGQTFNSTLIPDPSNQPTVNTINGAKFLVDNQEMTKIVFSGNIQQNYSSVSFIAGTAPNDKNWYWYSQVGAIDYYAGNTFYPNVTSSPSIPGPTTSTLGQVMINGSVASTNLNMNNFDITNANTIYSANILTLLPVNAVEIGEPQRRPASTYTEVINNVAECDQWANFPTAIPSSVDGVHLDNPTGVGLFDRLSTTVALSYDDGLGNPAVFECRIYTNIGGVETLIATSQSISVGNIDRTSFPPTMTSVVFTNDVAIPVITSPDYWFFRFELNSAFSYNYAYVGDLSSSPGTVVQTAAVYLKSVVDDPIDFFNVYGDSFFGNTVLHYANVVCENPLFPNVISTLNHERLFFDDILDAYQSYMTSQAMRMINSYLYAEVTSNGLVAYNTVAGTNTQIVPNFVNCSQSGGYSSSLTAQSLTINNSLGGILYNHQVNNSGFESTTSTSTNPSNTIAELTTNGQNALLVLRQIVNPSSSPVSHLFQISQPYSGDCVMSLISGSSPPRNLSMTSQGQISILSGTPSLIGQSTIGAVNNATMALNQRIILQTQQVDDFTNPTVQIWNNNASTASFPSIKFNKTTTATPAGSTVGAINFYARDAGNTSYEWGRITAAARNVTTGNQDGSLAISCLANGAISDFFTFNGADNENNSLKPLDMNGQSIKTSSGNLTLSATASTGTGHITFAPLSATGDLIFEGTNIQSATSGGNSGQHLRIKLNGVYYKIVLQAD